MAVLPLRRFPLLFRAAALGKGAISAGDVYVASETLMVGMFSGEKLSPTSRLLEERVGVNTLP